MDDKYQITIGVKVDDNDADINRKIDSVIDKCVEAKTAAAEVEQELKKVLMSKTSYKVYGKDELTEAGKKAFAKAKERFETEKAAKAAKDALEAEKQRNKEIAQRNKEVADLQNKLRNLGKGWPNPFEFLSAKNGLNFGGMLARFGRKHPAAAGLANIFNNWRAVWHFVDGIAELNKQLMQLAYTSGMGAGELNNLGNAAKAFGGSAATIAAGNERFVKTVEDMKRGGGMGFLGTIAYKYGFMADLGADWQTNTQRAIEMARGMDVNTRMAFLKDFDSSNYKQNMAYASMDKAKYDAYMGAINTPEKAAAAEGATAATEDYLMSTELLSSSWKQICDQLAEVLLPIMKGIVDCMTWVVDLVASLPKGLTATLTVIAGILALIKTISLITSAVNMARKIGLGLMAAEGAATKRNTALTWLGVAAELAKTFAKNPLMGTAALLGVAAIATSAGAFMYFNAQDARADRREQRRQERLKWGQENLSFDKVVSGEQKMTQQEQLAFGFNLERMFQSSLYGDKFYNFNGPSDSLTLLANSAMRAAEAMGETYDSAKAMADAIHLSAMATEGYNTYHRTVNTSSQTNVNMNNVFENASTEMLGEAFDMLAAEIRAASRSGVT